MARKKSDDARYLCAWCARPVGRREAYRITRRNSAVKRNYHPACWRELLEAQDES